MPLLMKVLVGSNPESFHWEIFHAVGILAFLLTVLLMNKILQIFNIPWRVRLIACLFFALHPVKNEAILWPAAIVGYVLPFLVFLFASWIYLVWAKQGRETITSLIVVLILILFSIFSIEQLVPLFSVLVFVRLLFFKPPRIQMMSNILGFILLTAIFAIVTFSGATAERIERHPFPSIASLPTHIMSVLSNSSVGILSYPFRILLDSCYWRELLSVVIGFDFLLVAILLTFLFWLLIRHFSSESCNLNLTPKMLRALFLVGFIIWIITLSPFMVTSYYIPNRALYIPLFGFSIMVAVLYEYIFQNVGKRWQKIALAAGLTGFLGIFVLINIYTQNDFEKEWRVEKQIITYLANTKKEILPNTEINLLNLSYASPSLRNDYALNGIAQWIFQGKNISGSTLKNLSEIFSFPIDFNSSDCIELSPQKNNWVLFWSDDHLVRVKKIHLFHNQNNVPKQIMNVVKAPRGTKQPVDLEALVLPLDMSAQYDNYEVKAKDIIFLKQLDIGLLRISIKGNGIADNRLRLLVHANYEGTKLPYDQNVSSRTGFQFQGKECTRDFFIKDFSKLKSLEISLTKKDRKLVRKNFVSLDLEQTKTVHLFNLEHSPMIIRFL